MLHKLSKTSDHNFLYIPISRSINAHTYSLKLRYPLPMNHLSIDSLLHAQ